MSEVILRADGKPVGMMPKKKEKAKPVKKFSVAPSSLSVGALEIADIIGAVQDARTDPDWVAFAEADQLAVKALERRVANEERRSLRLKQKAFRRAVDNFAKK